MIYVACECGSGIGVPEDFVGSPGECPDCGRRFCVAAGPATRAIESDPLDARLIIRTGPARVGELLFIRGQDPVEIGKLPGKPIELAGGILVSRNHCRLVRTPSGWRVEDQKSTNGLFVNGRRAASVDLKNGDRLRVGDYELEYVVPNPEPEEVELEEIGDEYELAEDPPPPLAQVYRPANEAATGIVPPPPPMPPPGPGDPQCPACKSYLPAGSQICVPCGINIRTGRALILVNDLDDEDAHERVLKIVRIASFVAPLSFYPVASEGYGKNKPYAVWAIAGFTTLVTILVWFCLIFRPDRLAIENKLILWSTDQPTADDIIHAYAPTNRDARTRWRAFYARISELENKMPEDEAIHTAYDELPANDRLLGEFRWYQLITNGFLHAGILHLAGNMLFLLVLGSRVNALIGQWKTALVYPLLLVASSAAQLASMSGHGAHAALGASGAIMGLAGMYFVVFPVQRIYLIIWFRFTLWIFVPVWWTNLYYKIWPIRGFWVVLFYIGCDVLATVLGSADGVAHWAHLGGFIAGMAIALTLLMGRQIDAHGADLLSVLLGRRAWALVGKPGQGQQPLPTQAAATVA